MNNGRGIVLAPNQVSVQTNVQRLGFHDTAAVAIQLPGGGVATQVFGGMPLVHQAAIEIAAGMLASGRTWETPQMLAEAAVSIAKAVIDHADASVAAEQAKQKEAQA